MKKGSLKTSLNHENYNKTVSLISTRTNLTTSSTFKTIKIKIKRKTSQITKK